MIDSNNKNKARLFSKLNSPAPISHLNVEAVSLGAYMLWKARKDLQVAFPLDTCAGQAGLMNWFRQQLLQFERRKSPSIQSRLFDRLQNQLTGIVHYIPYGMRRQAAHAWWHVRAAATRFQTQLTCNTESLGGHQITEDSRPSNHGVNLVGYLRAEKGMGQILRSAINTFSVTNVDFGVIDYRFGMTSRLRAPVPNVSMLSNAEYAISIIYINADQFWSTIFTLSGLGIFETHIIAVWLWELERFPEEWEYALDLVDEIWAPSTFIQNALSRVTEKPVLYMPFSVDHAMIKIDSIQRPEQRFTVLYIFDASSYIKRKNPIAVTQAFQAAFPSDDKNAKLILKSMNGGPDIEGWNELISITSIDDRIVLINEVWNSETIYGLIDSCDCYISLHRSEGFGFTIAEAMARGKPAIFTAYSGPMDFISENGCCPVGYELEHLREDDYPYASGQVWANPIVAEAARWLATLRAQPELARRIGRNGASFIHSKFSVQNTGALYLSRINRILDAI